MAYALRTRFKKEIVAEFLPPARARRTPAVSRSKKRHKPRERVVILCDGAPNMPSKFRLLEFFAHKGFWAIHPRYRGTWESDGVFLRKSPHEDILDILDQLPHGFTSAWDGKKYRVEPDEVYIFASSFGGPAGILASLDPRVTKVISISPVVDWHALGKAEPLDWMEIFFHEAFGNGYRFGAREWKKLSSGTFYNPVRSTDKIDGSKLFIFHAQDDESVRAREVVQFARTTGATLKLFKTGGHLSAKRIVPKYWKQIEKFMKR
jgi:pimeloyl-ACP methyl ester carboxylesterase